MLLKIILVFVIGGSMIINAPLKRSGTPESAKDCTSINLDSLKSGCDRASNSTYPDDVLALEHTARQCAKNQPE